MRQVLFLTISFVALSISGSTWGQPAPATTTPSVLNTQNGVARESTLERHALSGIKQKLDAMGFLNPDCSSAGDAQAFVAVAPIHGSIQIDHDLGYLAYPKDSIMSACNDKKVPVVTVYYRSDSGYHGDDAADINFIGNLGTLYVRHFHITIH